MKSTARELLNLTVTRPVEAVATRCGAIWDRLRTGRLREAMLRG